MAVVKKGKVYLVGAGPGDPGLMTLKGKECLSRADVVIYDYLANRSFLEYAKTSAEMIFVGKKGGCHTMGQAEINKLIVLKTQEGNTVVRLKGGDPYLFGRGGEEAQELVKAGLEFEVVPGVTSAISVPAYAGIPLTHRDYTSSVTFITGHESPFKEESKIAWDKIAAGGGTLVFLMGMGKLKNIADHLMKNGKSPDTPVAVIHRGTVPAQKTLVGSLHNISELAKEANMTPPAIIVVGEVVNLRDGLDWFEKRPLFGKRILVTRAQDQAGRFSQELTQSGAECIEFPTIKIVPPDSWDALDHAISTLDKYHWLLFTSANAVKYFLERLETRKKDVRDLKGIKIGAIGPKTADTWTTFGIRPDLMPNEYRAEAVVEAFKTLGPINGLKILMPRALKAREVLPDTLRLMGAEVDVIPAYQTVRPDHDSMPIRELLNDAHIHMVTFTSSSTVENFAAAFKHDGDRLNRWLSRVAVACIGEVTANTAEKMGFSVDLIAPEATIEAFSEAIVQYFLRRSQPSKGR